MVGWKLLNINIIQLGITNHHLHVCHHTFTAFICTLKSLLIQIKTTDPSIITRLRLNMTNWIHHNQKYTTNMHFIWNDGLEATRHQYQSICYHKNSSACVPLYSLYSHSKITSQSTQLRSINNSQFKVK